MAVWQRLLFRLFAMPRKRPSYVAKNHQLFDGALALWPDRLIYLAVYWRDPGNPGNIFWGGVLDGYNGFPNA